MFFKITEGHRQ